jgi:hypothetical protein
VRETQLNYSFCPCQEDQDHPQNQFFKQSLFLTLPNTLIFHLMRWSTDSAVPKKILDRYEFPIDDEILDMYDYSVENLNYKDGIVSESDVIRRN